MTNSDYEDDNYFCGFEFNPNILHELGWPTAEQLQTHKYRKKLKEIRKRNSEQIKEKEKK
jgi:hypothetical protein